MLHWNRLREMMNLNSAGSLKRCKERIMVAGHRTLFFQDRSGFEQARTSSTHGIIDPPDSEETKVRQGMWSFYSYLTRLEHFSSSEKPSYPISKVRPIHPIIQNYFYPKR